MSSKQAEITLYDGHTEVWEVPCSSQPLDICPLPSVLSLVLVVSHRTRECEEGSRLRLLTSAEFSVADPCLRSSLPVLEVAQRPGTLPRVPPQTALNVTSILAEDQQSFLQASW